MKRFIATWQGDDIEFHVDRVDSGHLKVLMDDQESLLDVVRVGEDHYSILHDNASYVLSFYQEGNAWQAYINGDECHFQLKDEKTIRREEFGGALAEGSGQIICPMPGKVISVNVSEGQEVNKGDGVVVVEAMKMQNEFKSEIDGVVKEVCVSAGDSVEGGAVLVVIE